MLSSVKLRSTIFIQLSDSWMVETLVQPLLEALAMALSKTELLLVKERVLRMLDQVYMHKIHDKYGSTNIKIIAMFLKEDLV